ncbi:L10-interacting MYB domain-containing protein [Camellia lanceoleosa]|uniref:L10-interacting MYB domain-containing protein n=1 Tax=Camellia lanceoleosa TaxID=1840588 RepID=A0ACC0GUQ0_9ERIC|nr:L10-interacting MYB domain-containing protein [Camellia lanceoleosa]
MRSIRVRYTVNRLKQKYHRIRQAYNTFVKLKNHTGFGWDEQRKTVMASDDVWDHYVKAHPKAKVFRKKGLDHIDLLDVLFANSQATGALASTQGPQPR